MNTAIFCGTWCDISIYTCLPVYLSSVQHLCVQRVRSSIRAYNHSIEAANMAHTPHEACFLPWYVRTWYCDFRAHTDAREHALRLKRTGRQIEKTALRTKLQVIITWTHGIQKVYDVPNSRRSPKRMYPQTQQTTAKVNSSYQYGLKLFMGEVSLKSQ